MPNLRVWGLLPPEMIVDTTIGEDEIRPYTIQGTDYQSINL
jgi:hypothetical protein